MATEFRPRPRLLAFAQTLPAWLAVWIIDRETRRAEAWLARKDARSDPRYQNFLGVGGLIMSSYAANRSAVLAQRQATEQAMEQYHRLLTSNQIAGI